MQRNKASRLKWAAIGLSLVLSVGLVSGCGNKGGAKKVVATYKNGQVTQAELDKFVGVVSFINPYFGDAGKDASVQEMMLKQYTTTKILNARASDANKKDAVDKTAEQMKQFDDYYKANKADADQRMKDAKITRDDVENYLKQTMTAINDIDSKITDQQLKDEYDKKQKENAHAFDVVTVSQVLVALKDQSGKDLRTKDEALKRAKEVQDKLNKGGDFAALAKDYSDDPGSKDNGGKYENQSLADSQWVEPFQKAAEELPIGKISDPVETEYGYHIMRVDMRKTQTLDEVKDQLKSSIGDQMISDFMDKELPTLDYKSNLPKPTPTPAATNGAASPAPAATGAASPAPAATGAASPAPSPAATAGTK